MHTSANLLCADATSCSSLRGDVAMRVTRPTVSDYIAVGLTLLLSFTSACGRFHSDPWHGLESTVNRFPVPSQFRTVTTSRFGSPCSGISSCERPWIGRYFVSDLPAESACSTAHDAFQQIPGLREFRLRDDGRADYAGCFAVDGRINDYYVTLLLFENTSDLRTHYPNLPSVPTYIVALHVLS